MPIYAYRCTTCGHAKDVLQKMSDPVLSVCPQCGAATFVKQVTAAGFQLKGSGWYVTDFKGGDKKPDAAKSDPAKADGAGGDAAKTDAATPAAKADGAKSDGAPAATPAPAAPAPAATPSSSPPSDSK